MAHLSICLLGPLQVTLDGEPVTGFESDKVRALLAYLAVESQQPQRRETLAGLLWPDWPERSARANLRHALANLRSAIRDRAPFGDAQATPPFLHTSRQTIQFNAASDAWVDVAAFTRLVKAAPRAEAGAKGPSRPTVERLEEAVALYGGCFLEGFSLADSSPFEEWILLNRERLHRQVTDALRRLAECHEQRGDYASALLHAWRQVELDPWRERAHRQVMRLLALSGQRGAALAQYETCRRLLAEELGVGPAADTTQLYHQIRDEALEEPPAAPARRMEPQPQPPTFLHEEEVRPEVERPVFVAREGELARLDGFLDLALAGHGRVAFVSGEAGSGKTALLQAFARQAQDAHPDLVVAGGNGVAYTGLGDPYHPFREVLTLLTGEVEPRWRAGAMTAEQARRLWDALPLAAQALLADGADLVDTFVAGKALVERARAFAPSGVGWLAELEELVERKAATPAGAGPQQSALFAQVTRVLQSLAQHVPLLLMLDDLQWADGGSISLLFHLGRQLAPSRMLVVGAYRPEEVALGRGGERHPLEPVLNELQRDLGEVTVDLGQAGGREFVDALLDSEPNRLGTEFRQTLYRQTRAHPLFTVELLRGMEERGDLVKDEAGRWVEGEALDWETLPARVEAVIAERVGRLPEGLRETLVTASVEGEEFTAEVVARAGGVDDEEVVQRLSGALDRKHRLVTTQGILWADGQRLSRYRFRHILFQRYLYNSLDRVKRAHLHEAVGTALERLYGDQTDEVAVELAYHFREASSTGKAVDYLRRAGERAARVSALEEAIAHFSRGLALLGTLPETPERVQQELMLQVGLGVALQTARGYGDSDAGHAFGRARELCAQVGESPHLLPLLWLLATFYGTRGDHRAAHELVQQIFSFAEGAEDPTPDLIAHCAAGWNQIYLGELTPARAHLERGIALYDRKQHRSLAVLYGIDFGAGALAFASWALWLLGYPEQALQRGREALASAEELAHPPSLALVQCMVGIFHVFRRDAQSARELGEACVHFCAGRGFSYWIPGGEYCHGWGLAQQGQVDDGIVLMRRGIADLEITGEASHTQRLASLAEVCGQARRMEEGLAILDDALAAVHRSAERFYEAEIHRIRGELLLLQGADEAEAEACFQRAIKIARQQSARMWELRATVSLCRLWQRQGKRKKARKRLAQIYGWFSEGFDTPDLQEAQALLEALA